VRISITIENYDAKAKKVGEVFDKVLNDAVEAAGRKMLAHLRRVSPKATGKYASSWQIRRTGGSTARVKGIGITNIHPAAFAVEYGRAPGTFPPPRKIAEWARAKGIIDSEIGFDQELEGPQTKLPKLRLSARVGRKRRLAATERPADVSPPRKARRYRRGSYKEASDAQIVFLISRKIERRGVPAQHVLTNATDDLATILRDSVAAALSSLNLGGAGVGMDIS